MPAIPPPDQYTPVDSVIYRDWFEKAWSFFKDAGRLNDVQTWTKWNHFTNAVDIKGPWPASLVVTQDNAVDPHTWPWAITAQSLVRDTILDGVEQVAGYFQAASLGGGEVWGIATETVCGMPGGDTTKPRSATTLVGAEHLVANFFDNNTTRKVVGVNPVFSNRPSVAGTPLFGLGNNHYTYDSAAIWITSIPRSSAGEYCGWVYGIQFAANSLDRNTGGPGIAIDMHALDPARTNIGMWMPDNMPILFDTAGNVGAVFASSHWSVTLNGTEVWGVNTSTGVPSFHGTTQAGGALPGTTTGYLNVFVGGVAVKIPYY